MNDVNLILNDEDLSEMLNALEDLNEAGDYEYIFEKNVVKFSEKLSKVVGCNEKKLMLTALETLYEHICPSDLIYLYYKSKKLKKNKRYSSKYKISEINEDDIYIYGKDTYSKNNILLKEALEYSNLKTEFLSNMSHELRTPLNIIFSSIQLFKVYLDNEDDLQSKEKLYNYVNIMKQNCYRLLRLINNLIDSTKIDAGFLSLNMHNQDIICIIANICNSIKGYIESKDLTFTYHSTVTNKIMSCDAEKIEQIILNLLSNAVKFSKPHGKIQLNVSENNGNLIISVKDNGIGIPKEKQKIIFNRFRQVQPLMNRNHEGSGIGLSIVKSLVEMHNGEISVISEENAGSEFIVEIPILQNKNCNCNENKQINFNPIEKIYMEFSDIYN